MINSKLTDRCQTTVPREIRRKMGLKPGMQMQWEIQEDGTIVVRPEQSPLDCFESLKGEKVAKTLSEQLDEGNTKSVRDWEYENSEIDKPWKAQMFEDDNSYK